MNNFIPYISIQTEFNYYFTFKNARPDQTDTRYDNNYRKNVVIRSCKHVLLVSTKLPILLYIYICDKIDLIGSNYRQSKSVWQAYLELIFAIFSFAS